MDIEILDEFFQMKKGIHHVRLSETLSGFMFGLLKMIRDKSSVVPLNQEDREVIAVNELYEYIHVSRPAISKALKECESKGYINRFVSDKDKRYMYVGLSECGRQTLNIAEKEIKESFEWILNQFSEDEILQIRKSVIKITQVLNDFEKGR